jgi:hypothetical protein
MFLCSRLSVPLQKSFFDMVTVSILNTFNDIYISSMLPEDISFTSDYTVVTVDLYIGAGTEKFFSADYYTYNGVATFKDMRSIVETLMIERGLNKVTIRLVYSDEISLSYVDGIKVVFASYKYAGGSYAFLDDNFLTTRKSAMVPRSGKLVLNYYVLPDNSYTSSANVFFSRPEVSDEIRECYLSLPWRPSTEGTRQWIITYDNFKTLVEQETGFSGLVIHSIQLQLGNRLFQVFFCEEEPTEQFTFRNGYNVKEIAYFYAKQSIKTKVEKNEAICGKTGQFYDVTATLKREVETAPMQKEEALWLNQFFTSHLVTKKVANDEDAEVLISDISSEVSDSNKELTRLKFSWRYADGEERDE